SPAGEFVSGDSTRIGSMVASGLVHWTSGQGFGPPGTNQLLPALPGHSVKPGDTWTQTVTRLGPYGQGSVTYKSQNHFLRYEDLPSGRAAVIQTKTTVPLDDNVDLQSYAGTGGSAGPTPAPIGAPGSGMVRVQVTYATSTTTWFEVQTGQVARTTTVFTSDQTTTFSAFTGPAPPGVQTDVNGQPVSPIHQVGNLTLRLDLLPARS
ncbi:MAG: hypothetical protein J2P28_19525, partial [Actinobacteria bacterium]|nr:hypothetical protein [Actinomycetota bacterium]